QKLAPGPGQRKPRTPPTDASHAAGRVGGGRSSCGARRSRAGIGARQQPLRGGDDGGARGAWRLDGRARRVEIGVDTQSFSCAFFSALKTLDLGSRQRFRL
ncbi:hypothetical protein Ctob_014858, partial [Chrysochromulina tobinii]